MVAASPDIAARPALDAKPLEAPFLYRLGRRLQEYVLLTRLNRPIGIWLLLWPVLWALWLSSNGKPDPHVFIVFVLGVVLTRSAGCAMNDFADRNFDRHVARTRDRPLVTGQVDKQVRDAAFELGGTLAASLMD